MASAHTGSISVEYDNDDDCDDNNDDDDNYGDDNDGDDNDGDDNDGDVNDGGDNDCDDDNHCNEQVAPAHPGTITRGNTTQ